MHHTCAYTAAVAATAETDLAALTDTSLTIQNGHFLPQRPVQLVYWGAAGGLLTKVRLSTPTLVVITTPFLRDISVAQNFGSPMHFDELRQYPLTLTQLEEITAFVTQSAVTSTQNYVILGLMIQDSPAPAGQCYTIRGTATATLTANAWTNVSTITWQNTLPTGVYSVIGATFESANCVAGRLILENWPWRPGGLGIVGVGNLTNPLFRHGRLGDWGRFHSYVMPQVEMLSGVADTTEEITLDIVKVA